MEVLPRFLPFASLGEGIGCGDGRLTLMTELEAGDGAQYGDRTALVIR